jgi:hypothetical protein
MVQLSRRPTWTSVNHLWLSRPHHRLFSADFLPDYPGQWLPASSLQQDLGVNSRKEIQKRRKMRSTARRDERRQGVDV